MSKKNLWFMFSIMSLFISTVSLADDPNLIAHWNLDETSGSTAYDSVGSNNGTLCGDANWISPGQIGGGIDLDGNGDYVTYTDAFNYDNKTVAFWFRLEPSAAGSKNILGNGLYLAARKGFNFWYYNNGISSTSNLNLSVSDENEAETRLYKSVNNNKWYHAALVQDNDANTVSLYVNGELADSETDHIGYTNAIYNLKIGAYAGSNGYNLEGKIDDVRIYNKALTDTQISELYTNAIISSTTVQNPGFEDVIYDGEPNNWTDQFASTLKILDPNIKHSGDYSWKFYNDGTKYSGALSNYIEVDPNTTYKYSLWVKSEYGTEDVHIGWQEYDSNYNVLSNVSDFYANTVPTQWTYYFFTQKPTHSNTAYVRLRIFGPYEGTGTVWWDDFSFKDPANSYLDQYGYENSDDAKSVDFGDNTDTDPNYHGGIIWENAYSSTAMGDRVSGDPNYRELYSNNGIILKIPEFNVDANGLPLSPMLLEIHYQDTIDPDDELPYFTSMINYHTHDPNMLKNPTDDPNDPDSYYTQLSMLNYPIGSIGGNNDNKWKYQQYVFDTTQFQLLRSINGYFELIFNNSNDYNALPIDYISLRVIDANECSEFYNVQRDIHGFYEVEISDIGENDPGNYNDPNLTLFTRDPMKPVYEHTRPKSSEVVSSVSGYSFLNETEPICFSIYSKDGLSGLTIDVNDLVNTENSSYIITKPTIYKVVCDNNRMSFSNSLYKYGFALIPDRIEEFSTVTINPDSSQRFWIKIQVPSIVIGGQYNGTITIKKNSTVLQSIPISLSVYDAALELSGNINPVYHDPFLKTYSTSIQNVLDLYSETGLDPFYYIRNEAIEPNIVGDTIVNYDVSVFEERLERMIDNNFAKDIVVVELSYSWQDEIYKHYYGGRPDASPKSDLWNNLSYSESDPNFYDAMNLFINTLEDVADDHNLTFIYSVTDEPGDDPYRRIISDRIYTIIHDANALTTVTYHTECESSISAGDYVLPQGYNGLIPPLSNLVDFKVWAPSHQGDGYDEGYDNYGYYTTNTSYLRNPIYNRFTHGFLAFATDAKMVSAYAMGDYIGDPFNDFDSSYYNAYPYTSPDYLLAYPTWNGTIIPTMAIEGIREGIKDAKYIATLQNLIATDPNDSTAIEANTYLNTIKNRIDTDYWDAYPAETTEYGYTGAILEDLSDTSDPNDFEAFTTIRNKIVDYILDLE